MKVASELHDRPGFFEVDGKIISGDQLTALQKLFPGDWLTIRWEDPATKQNKYEYD